MSISKVSRGLVVCIFTLFIVFLAGIDIYSTVQNGISLGNIYLKLLYIFSLVSMTAVYSVIKEKLSKIGISKKKNVVIRYIIIVVVSFVIKVLIGIFIDPKQIIINSIFYAFLAMCSGIILKKIIYNISKSDVLSVIGMLMYMFLPNVNLSFVDSITSYVTVGILLVIIMLMQKIIDELKQIGIKNLKYVRLSILLGCFIAVSMLLGINAIVWVVVAFFSLICTSNLDKTHVNFPNKFINTLRQRSKELLYRFERIYINKIFIVILITTVVSTLLYFLICYFVYDIIKCGEIIDYISTIKSTNNLQSSINIITNVNYIDAILNLQKLVLNSKIYILLLIIYIIFIEFLNVALRRKYDTKSTIIKVMFVSIILAYSVFNLNYIMYYQVMNVFLILICIINTTNLYLNRDERIKLLNS